MDMSDIRTLFHFFGHILNFHLLVIPIFSRHIGENIFLHAVKPLDVIAPKWNKTIASVSADDECKITGLIHGLATRFEQAALPVFYRIWCGLHQLYIKLHSFLCL